MGRHASLFAHAAPPAAPPVALPRAVGALIELAVCHRDPERYALLYSLVWRVRHGERALPEVPAIRWCIGCSGWENPCAATCTRCTPLCASAPPRSEQTERFVAWFEPDHFILEATADFFVDRFGSLAWSILTPIGSLHWDRSRLTHGPAGHPHRRAGRTPSRQAGAAITKAPSTRRGSIPTVMRAHMAKKYWRNMPEAAAIPDLIRSAPSRVKAMIEQEHAMPRKRDPQKAVAAMRRLRQP